jgi:putative endonuclease
VADKRAVGRVGEEAAASYLIKHGYRILYRNFRYGRYGEIDIIAQKAGAICFIEVKSRSGGGFGAPAEAVGYSKRKKILTVANHFLRINRFPYSEIRLDVIEVYYEYAGTSGFRRAVKEIRHIENAFGE